MCWLPDAEKVVAATWVAPVTEEARALLLVVVLGYTNEFLEMGYSLLTWWPNAPCDIYYIFFALFTFSNDFAELEVNVY